MIQGEYLCNKASTQNLIAKSIARANRILISREVYPIFQSATDSSSVALPALGLLVRSMGVIPIKRYSLFDLYSSHSPSEVHWKDDRRWRSAGMEIRRDTGKNFLETSMH